MSQWPDAVVKGLYHYRLLSALNLLNSELARSGFSLSLRHCSSCSMGSTSEDCPPQIRECRQHPRAVCCFAIFSKPAVEPTPRPATSPASSSRYTAYSSMQPGSGLLTVTEGFATYAYDSFSSI